MLISTRSIICWRIGCSVGKSAIKQVAKNKQNDIWLHFSSVYFAATIKPSTRPTWLKINQPTSFFVQRWFYRDVLIVRVLSAVHALCRFSRRQSRAIYLTGRRRPARHRTKSRTPLRSAYVSTRLPSTRKGPCWPLRATPPSRCPTPLWYVQGCSWCAAGLGPRMLLLACSAVYV